MKRNWIITILLCLLLLGTGIAAITLPQVVPLDQCSDVYKKYAEMDGIDATFVKDFRINDTLVLDVTILKALDSNRFKMLKSEFGCADFSTEKLKDMIAKGKDFTSIKCVFYDDSNNNLSTLSKIKEVLTVTHISYVFTFFHVKNDSDIYAILDYTYPIPTTNAITYPIFRRIIREYPEHFYYTTIE